MPRWSDRPEAWHEILPGVRRRILTSGGGVMMVLYRIAPGSLFPKHTHPHVQAGTFLEGGGRFEVGAETWTMKAGSSYLVPSGVPHELRTDAGAESVILDVFVPDREEFLGEALPPDPP